MRFNWALIIVLIICLLMWAGIMTSIVSLIQK